MLLFAPDSSPQTARRGYSPDKANTKSVPNKDIAVDAWKEPHCSRALASRLAEQFSASFPIFRADVSSQFLERQTFLALNLKVKVATNHRMTQRLVELTRRSRRCKERSLVESGHYHAIERSREGQGFTGELEQLQRENGDLAFEDHSVENFGWSQCIFAGDGRSGGRECKGQLTALYTK